MSMYVSVNVYVCVRGIECECLLYFHILLFKILYLYFNGLYLNCLFLIEICQAKSEANCASCENVIFCKI